MAKHDGGMRAVQPPKLMVSGNKKIGRGGGLKLQTDMKLLSFAKGRGK